MRDIVEKRLTELWDFERFSAPVKEAGRYYYSYNNGLLNQNLIFTQTRLEDEPKLLIDPNTWSDDGTVALAAYFPSPDNPEWGFSAEVSDDGAHLVITVWKGTDARDHSRG